MTILLGLAGAPAYGFADFLGGLTSRSIRPIVVTAWVALIGLVPLAVGLAVLGGRFTPDALLWGTVAGMSGSLGVLMLYTALAVGPMSVLSPVTSVVSVIVPVGVGLVFAASRLSGLGVVAMIGAVIGVGLVGAVKDRSGSRLTARGLLTAGIAGCGFGGLMIAYAATAPEDGLAPLVVARVVQTAEVLPVVSVLNALYPIGTVVLAAIVLRERLTRLQIIGLALALTTSAVLATT